MSVTAMIAPDASIGKSEWKLPPSSRDCDIVTGDHHGFVNGIIILPNSGQARAKLECDWGDCCLRARSCLGVPDSLAPQPPGVQGGSGPLSASMRSVYGSIPMTFGRLEPAFFSRQARPMTEQACSLARRLVICLVDRRERRAEDRLRLFHRAALHQHSRFIDVGALER